MDSSASVAGGIAGLVALVASWVSAVLIALVRGTAVFRGRLSSVLPDPARCVPPVDLTSAAVVFRDADCAGSPAAAAGAAMDADKPLVVFAVSPLHPACTALLADIANTSDESLKDAAAAFVSCAVDVTSSALEPEVPAALRNVTSLPAVALYVPSRRGREFALVCTAEGVTHATTVAALMEEVLLRTHRTPAALNRGAGDGG
jgi:hypothetical protein